MSMTPAQQSSQEWEEMGQDIKKIIYHSELGFCNYQIDLNQEFK